MKQYDVDAEFDILFSILEILKNFGDNNEADRRCIAYISDKITNLMDPEYNLNKTYAENPEDYMDGAIPAIMEEEIHFAPDDSEYEFYSASMDDVIEDQQLNLMADNDMRDKDNELVNVSWYDL